MNWFLCTVFRINLFLRGFSREAKTCEATSAPARWGICSSYNSTQKDFIRRVYSYENRNGFKITVGVIAIIVIAFIGSRQLLSPEEDSSPSAEVAASTADKPDQSGSEIDANRKNVVTAPSRADEPQISAKEMEQIEDFFAQLEEADTQSNTNQLTEAEFQQDEEESIPTNTGRFTEVTEQSAKEVMNASWRRFGFLTKTQCVRYSQWR